MAPVLSFFILLALSRQGITWFIDGNNLVGHRGTPKDPNVVANKLIPVQAERIVLVFDGTRTDDDVSSTPPDAARTTTRVEELGTRFQRISLGSGLSADDYIQEEIQRIAMEDPRARIQVVTADRELRRQVRERSVVRHVVNPVTFWRRYLPRLTGMKGRSCDFAEDQSKDST